MKSTNFYPLILNPTIKNYIWGGFQLKPYLDPAYDTGNQPVAEIWAIYDQNKIENGFLRGQILAELVADYPLEMLGKTPTQGDSPSFPLLIKLLDCQNWLSVQVHPDDKGAHQLEGPRIRGKSEAWFFLDADPQSQIIAGTKPAISQPELEDAIQNNKILDVIQWHQMNKNDCIYIPAGTIHALGPGLVVYELQQSSDLTYRVFDWDRPLSAGRELHIQKSIHSARLSQSAPKNLEAFEQKDGVSKLIDCEYFSLKHIENHGEILIMDTRRTKLHALTIIEGNAEVIFQQQVYTLQKFQSLLIPAALGQYQLSGEFKLLLATNEE